MRKRTRIISLLLCLTLLCSLLPINILAIDSEDGFANFTRRNEFSSNTFEDVPDGEWYYENIKAVYQLGLMIGHGSTFNTEGNITIAETITIAARIHSIFMYGTDEFEESNPWYQTYVDYALQNGIIANEYDDYTAYATRADFAYILASALPEYALEAINKVADGKIPDVDIDATYADAVYTLYRAGVIIGGDAIGTFAPESFITRSEVAAIATRMADKSLRKSIQLGEEYVVTFDTNGAKKSIPEHIVFEGDKVEKPKDPSRGMYKFDGWFTEPKGGEPFDFDAPIMSDVTVYAQWEVDKLLMSLLIGAMREEEEEDETEEKTFTVTFNANGDNVENMPSPSIQKVINGEFASYWNNPTRNGYVFTGWFLESNSTDFTQSFDISFTPITEDVTLYAGWASSADSDGDSLIDEVETWYHTDINNSDTDGDGLTDYQEILIVGSNPLKSDTDDNGTIDSEEDFDNDGSNNFAEITHGTNPLLSDTDIDGLSDSEEVTIYFTNPLLYDTDEDGVSDGKEVELNTNPCVKENTFKLEKTYSGNSQIIPIVEIELSGDQVETLSICENNNHALFPENMPGYLGSAFNFSVDGSFDSAKISFAFDSEILTNGCIPTIYYFNEEEQYLEELATEINGNIASTVVTHFSTYILLDKKTFDEVWETEIKQPVTDDAGQISGIDVAFAIDVSGSMNSYSRLTTAKSAATTFIDALTDSDRAGLIKFANYATVISTLTSDIAYVKSKVSSLSAYGGTAIYDGLDEAVKMLSDSNETYGYKMVIILSDGLDEPSTSYDRYYKAIVETAKNNNIIVYTIGIGTQNRDILTAIAENTDGKYYLASQVTEITDAFKEIQADTVDLTNDTDEDGIPDYYEDHLTSFNGLPLRLDKNNPDSDGDGLLDGEEIYINVSKDGKVYGKMNSDPNSDNSDDDYYKDFEEVKAYYTNPMIKNVSIEDSHLYTLIHDPYYYAANYKKRYDESPVLRASIWVGNNVYGSNYCEKLIYKQALLGYFDKINKKISAIEEVKNITAMGTSIFKFAFSLVDGAIKYAESVNYLSSIEKLKDTRNQLTNQWKNFEELKKLVGSGKSEYLARIEEVKKTIYALTDQSDELNNCLEAASKNKRLTLDVSPINNKTMNKLELAGDILTIGVLPFIEAVSDSCTLKSNLSTIQQNIYMLDVIINTTSNSALRDAAIELKSNAQSEFDATFSIVSQTLENAGYTFVGESIKKAISKCHPVAFWVNLSIGIVDFIIPVSEQSEACLKIYGMACAADSISRNLCNYLASGKQSAINSITIYAMYDDSGIESLNRFFNFADMRIYGEQLMIDMQNIGAGWLQWLKGVFGTDSSEIIADCENTTNIVNSYKDYYLPMYY